MAAITERECPILGNAGHLARKKETIGKKEKLECSHSNCDRVNCLKPDDPNFRTLYIAQSGGVSKSSVERFYNRLEKTLQIIK